MDKLESVEYKVYEDIINIQLFNEIVAFIKSTTNNKDKYTTLLNIEKNCIWYKNLDSSNIQDKYGFEYFGELLERYDERIGNKIENTRAIALALGYCSELIESNMIIGTQLIDFLNKIQESSADIYLKSALYLYDNIKYEDYANQLIEKKYCNTEELIFVLNVLNNDIENVFNQKKTEIIEVFGKNRTISPIGNIKLYSSLINTLYPIISKSRKKDISLLKALINLPTGYQKEDTTVYKELINNNYSKEEIAYLNYIILFYNTVEKAVRLYGSMVEEKIAIALCKEFINSEQVHSEDTYELINKILEKYNRFKIRCYGANGIKEALEKEINIINPITFINLYKSFNYRLFSFDILDSKWDIIAEKFSKDEYEKLFDEFLLYGNYKKKEIIECINKYNKLTNSNYLDTFLVKNKYRRDYIFSFLVDNDVIELNEYFNKTINSSEQNHLSEYLRGVRNRNSFDFLKYLLKLNKYNISEIDSFGFEFRSLYHDYTYSSDIDIRRHFLNEDEIKFLFNRIEEYMFFVRPNEYINFLKAIINNSSVEKTIPKEKLREVYKLICEIDPRKYNDEELQEKYLTAEELAKIRGIKRKEKILKERKRKKELKKEVIEKFNSINKDDVKELFDICDRYYYNSFQMHYCYNIVKKYIQKNIHSFGKKANDIKYFAKLLSFGISKEIFSAEECLKLMSEFVKEEDINYGIIARAC